MAKVMDESKIRLYKTDFQFAYALSLSLWLFSLTCSDGASCHVVSCSIERPTWQGTKCSLWLTAWKELNHADSHASDHGSDPCPPGAALALQLSQSQIPDPQK